MRFSQTRLQCERFEKKGKFISLAIQKTKTKKKKTEKSKTTAKKLKLMTTCSSSSSKTKQLKNCINLLGSSSSSSSTTYNNNLLIRLLSHSVIHSFIHLIPLSFIHSFIYSFVRSFYSHLKWCEYISVEPRGMNPHIVFCLHYVKIVCICNESIQNSHLPNNKNKPQK